jgi:hypothetical protein
MDSDNEEVIDAMMGDKVDVVVVAREAISDED